MVEKEIIAYHVIMNNFEHYRENNAYVKLDIDKMKQTNNVSNVIIHGKIFNIFLMTIKL